MPSKMSRATGGTTIRPVYLDKNSGLNDQQRETINTILFNHYRRFKRSTAVTEADEPLVLKNFENYSRVIQNVTDRSYGNAHLLAFTLDVKNMVPGNTVDIGTFKNVEPQIFYQAGGSGVNEAEILPGYFFTRNNKLVFECAGNHNSNYFKCTIFWMD